MGFHQSTSRDFLLHHEFQNTIATSPKPIYLVDAIGPFFRDYGRVRINWSKIPWRRLSKLSGRERAEGFAQIREDMRRFVERAAETGFNAISLDDVAHLALHDYYEADVLAMIGGYRDEFRRLFEIIREAGLDLFVTMDVVSLTPELRRRFGNESLITLRRRREQHINAFVRQLLDRFFRDFPEVSGLILRIGEADGLDVKDDFRSELYLKNPPMVRRFFKAILPIFEKHAKTCIFRTWTVGAHRIGDLIWRDSTLEQSLAGIDSPSLVLSMKYGESDFFRYLPLNRNFFVTDLPRIVELQTRREYEGAGEFPSFIGWDYERIARELETAPNVIGFMAWCQTGGWHPFRRLTWLENDGSAIWNEINTFVTLRIFKDGESAEEAIRSFPGCAPDQASSWIELLRLSHEVVRELLYLPEYARKALYFRRVRLPPLMGVYWHNLFINHSIKKFLMHLVQDGEACIRDGHAAMRKIARMKELAAVCGLPGEDIEYMEATFGLMALAREYFFCPFDEKIEKRLTRAKKAYQKKYPRGSRYRYAVKLDFTPFQLRRRTLGWFFNFCVREQPQYRMIDRILTLRLLPTIYRIARRTRPEMIPKFARTSAMGIDAIFR